MGDTQVFASRTPGFLYPGHEWFSPWAGDRMNAFPGFVLRDGSKTVRQNIDLPGQDLFEKKENIGL